MGICLDYEVLLLMDFVRIRNSEGVIINFNSGTFLFRKIINK